MPLSTVSNSSIALPAPDPLDQDLWDVIVIGSGVGGLVTASQLAAKGARVLVLERYLIPGGSGGSFRRQGYTFDVGASMIFGFGSQGHTNLLTRALADVGEHCVTIPDLFSPMKPREFVLFMTPAGRFFAVLMRCHCYRLRIPVI